MLKKLLISVFVRSIYPYGSIRRVFLGPLRGLSFYVSPGVGLTYVLGYDSMNWNFLKNKIRSGMVVFDVGANRGQMGLFFSNAVGPSGKVFCFEPVPQLVDELRKNLCINSIKNVEALPYAIAEKKGAVKFHFSQEFSSEGKICKNGLVSDREDSQFIEVKTRSIDALIDGGLLTPKLIKIDVEGAAALVFEGAIKLLDKHPDIYLELHGPEEQKAIGDYLVPRGYKFQDMGGNEIQDPVNTWCSPIWCSINDTDMSI